RCRTVFIVAELYSQSIYLMIILGFRVPIIAIISLSCRLLDFLPCQKGSILKTYKRRGNRQINVHIIITYPQILDIFGTQITFLKYSHNRQPNITGLYFLTNRIFIRKKASPYIRAYNAYGFRVPDLSLGK